MYSHLPEEFQEIARRLSRQDHQLKLNARQNTRGRLNSRSTSTVASSRASSVSPNRGRSKTRNRPQVPSLPLQKTTHCSSSPNRQGCLSRSSSIRSIPTTPTLHTKHPATSIVLYDKKCRSRNGSPSPSHVHSPVHSCCSSRASSPTGSRSRSKSRSRPGTPKSGGSQPATPIRQLYQFTQANNFIPGSPKSSGRNYYFSLITWVITGFIMHIFYCLSKKVFIHIHVDWNYLLPKYLGALLWNNYDNGKALCMITDLMFLFLWHDLVIIC